MTTKISAADAPPKILVEFSLTNESKAILQNFFTKNFLMMRVSYPLFRKKLQQVIRETFPKEALEEVESALTNGSGYAILVRNCPERTGFNQQQDALPEQSYSHFLGRALYEMFDVKHLDSLRLLRHNTKKVQQKTVAADVIHRDGIARKEHLFSTQKIKGRYIILSSPLNDEHAVTEVFNIERAIASVPEHERQNIFIGVKLGDDEKYRRISLERLQHYLTHYTDISDRRSVSEVSRLEWDRADKKWKKTESAFNDALSACSIKVNLQPGDLLLLDEHSLFHGAQRGDVNKISQIPSKQLTSRFLIHNAGAPVTQR